MTHYLSTALGAAQPAFSQEISELERASGAPGADIRLTAELLQHVRQAMAALGLDPQDTTGTELYAALQERLRQDDARLHTVLGIDSEADTATQCAAIANFAKKEAKATTGFVLKSTVAKRLLRKKPPAKTMKRLGYRSLDSMLKHETAPQLYAAAAVLESASWHRSFLEQYNKLTTSDFEPASITIVAPQSKRWQAVGDVLATQQRHNILAFKELGAIVLLPMSHTVDAFAMTVLLLTLHFMNDIRAYSSYIKLQQVKPQFGKMVRHTARTAPMTSAQLAGKPIAWSVIQRFYGKLHASSFHAEVFEPHIQAEDLTWKDAEAVLAQLDPQFAFWQQTQFVCTVHDGEPLSLNILDVALGYCNHLSFPDRVVHFAREHLWHELALRYLHQENLEAAVHRQLANELVDGATAS